ncbi:MAG: exopolysaccharide biosynthesis protein [Halofilum sp. (in: g-proteobacteria)]
MDQDADTDAEISDLTQLLDRIGEVASQRERVSLGDLIARLGERSFGPLLLLAGLITLAPLIGDIPGVPTLLALIVLLVAGQLLLGRDRMWLPGWLLERSITRDKIERSLGWLRRPARGIDRMLRPRLTLLAGGIGGRAIALACIVIAIAMPPMELVPFSANGAGIALTAFGLALIAKDGLLSLLAFITTFGTLGAVVYGLL